MYNQKLFYKFLLAMLGYFFVSNIIMYDIFAHTKLHIYIDSQTNIFYFEHIQSTELSTQLWMKNELQFNWLSNTDKYLCFIFMYGIFLERVPNNNHTILSYCRIYKFIKKNLFIIEWLLRKFIFNIYDFLYNLRCAFIPFPCELLCFTFMCM